MTAGWLRILQLSGLLLCITSGDVHAQLSVTSLPDVLFKESTWAVVEESVLWLYCEVNSTASSLVVAWSKDGDRLVQDVPHIRMRRSTSGSTTILLLVVDIFLESDVGTYRCTAQDGQDTASGTSLNLTASLGDSPGALRAVSNDTFNTEVDDDEFPDNRTMYDNGDTATLTLVVDLVDDSSSSYSIPSVLWLKDGAPVISSTPNSPVVGSNGLLSTNLTFTFNESDAGVYQCIFIGRNLTEVLGAIPIRLDSGELKAALRRISPSVVFLTPPEKLVIEVAASGGYSGIVWSSNGKLLGNRSDPTLLDVEFTHFNEIFVREPTSMSDYGIIEAQFNGTETRIKFLVISPESPNTAVVASDMVIVVEGESVTISCNSSGAPAPSITWTLNSQNPPFNQTDVVTEATATLVSSNSSDPTSPSAPNVTEGSVVSTLHIDGALYPDHDGVYQCSGSNSMAASTNTSSVNITVQVHVVPEVQVTADRTRVKEEENVTLTCDVSRGNPMSYTFTWSHVNTTNIFSSTSVLWSSATLNLPFFGMMNTGIYICSVMSNAGTGMDNITIELGVVPVVLSRVEPPVDPVVVVVGSTVQLVCDVSSGDLPIFLSWINPASDVLSTDINGSISINTSVTFASSEYGNYTCTANNSFGVGTDVLSVIQAVQPNVIEDDNQTLSPEVVAGDNLTLSVSIIDFNLPLTDVVWRHRDNIISGEDRVTITNHSLSLAPVISTLQRTAVIPRDSGNYSITATNSAGSQVLTFVVTVTETPDISFPEDSQHFVTNEQTNITFSCIASGSPAPSISFSYEGQVLNSTEGGPSSGGPLMDRVQLRSAEMSLVTTTGLYNVTRTLILFAAVDADSGNFSCSASADNGVISDTVIFGLTVLVAANITEMPVNQTVTSPDDATFSCTASGLPRPNITWTSPDSVTLVSGVNDTTITEDDSGGERSLVSTLYIINASPSSSGEYTCNADNTVGRGDTLIMATASLTVYVNPTITEFLPSGGNRYVVNATDEITFQCTATGVPSPLIKWFRGDSYLNSSSDLRLTLSSLSISEPRRALGMAMQTLTINGTTIDDAASNYSCRASNMASGGMASEMFELFVQAPPEVVSTSPDQRVTANVGGSASLTFRIGNAVPAVQTAGLRWYYINIAPSGTPEFSSDDFQEITNLTNRTSMSMLAFSNGGLTLTVSSIVQAIGDVMEADQGRYFLEATNPAGKGSNYIDLVVKGPPLIVSGPQAELVINDGSSAAVFSCEAIAFPEHNVTWSYTNSTGDMFDLMFDLMIATDDDGAGTDKYVIVGDRNGTEFGRLTVNNVTYEDRGTYTCTAANGVGMVSSSGNLTVHVIPMLVNISRPRATTFSQSVAIFCQASGFPIPNITWQKNGTDVITTNTSRLMVFSFSPFLVALDNEERNDFESSISELIGINGLDVNSFISTDELRVVGVLYFEGVMREDSDTYTCTASNGFPSTTIFMSVSEPVPLIVLERPDPPINVTASAAGPRSIILTWTSAFVGNSPVQSFIIYISNVNISSVFTQVANISVSSVVLNSNGSYVFTISSKDLVPPFTLHSLRAVSCNMIGCSNQSQESKSILTDQDLSSPPRGVSVNVMSTSTLTVVGMPPNTSNGIITKYSVNYTGSKDYNVSFSDTNSVSFSLSETGGAGIGMWQIVLVDLTPGTTYRITVAAVNGAVSNNGVGMISSPATGITQSLPPPPPPQPPTVLAKPLSSDPLTYTILLTHFSEINGRISHFHVVVVIIPLGQTINDLKEPDKRYKSITDFDVYNEDFCREQRNTPKAYITSEFGQDQLPPDRFVIGVDNPGVNSPNDRQSIYRNGPLCHEAVYTFFIRAYSESNSASVSGRSARQVGGRQYTMFTSTGYYSPATISPAPRNTTGVVVAVVIVLLLVIIAVVIAIILVIVLLRRFLPSRKSCYEMNDCKHKGGDSAIILMDHTPSDEGSDFRQPIPLSSLADHLERMHWNENCGFGEEYRIIQNKSANKSVVVCMQSDNKPRNRYANIQTFDETRVTLKPEEGSEHDYINANFIDGFNRPREYIAAQGPLPCTTVDFWRMVWEYDCSNIVMLTNLMEKMKIKCSQYWPNSGSSSYANYDVTLLDTITLADFVIRHFHITNTLTGKMKEVRQFHYISWPDFGVPRHATPLLYFMRWIRNSHKYSDKRPLLVHCSAGVGRTGTLLTIDAELQRAETDSCVDPFNFVHQLRKQRNHMVQTEAQYIFLHDAIFEGTMSGKTEVPVNQLSQRIKELEEVDKEEEENGFKKEFQLLRQFKVNVREFTDASDDCNQFKNRVTNALPYNFNRVQLEMQPGVGGSDYINASFIDGYASKDTYIATQGPLSNTVEDFWRMIWERSVSVIVMLTQLVEKGKEQCAQYWPSSTDCPEKLGKFTVELIEQNSFDDYLTRDMKLTQAESGNSHTVRQFHFTAWPEHGAPTSGVGMVDLIDQVTRRQQQQLSGNYPIVVHCSAGIGRTGAFCSLSTAIERVKAEGMVDIFHTVKHLRTQRPHMVQSEDQYTFCYCAVHDYVESLNNYSNFQ